MSDAATQPQPAYASTSEDGAAAPRKPALAAAAVTASRPARRVGLRSQLAVFSVLLVLVAVGGAAFAGWQVVDGLIQQGTSDRLNAASSTIASLYQQRVGEAEIVAHQMTERAGLVGQINRRAADQIEGVIEPIQSLRPQYSIMVSDTEGNILAARVPVGRVDPGPNLLVIPGAAESLELVAPVTALYRVGDCQMTVAVSEPVRNLSNGNVVGLVQLRFLLDDEFVRQVKVDTGIDVSLYCGDLLVASTVRGQSGGQSIRADPATVSHVLMNGTDWEENLRLPGQAYRARYVPLLDVSGKPVGMYAASIPVQTLRDARNAILRFFLPMMSGIALLAMVIGYLGSTILASPLRRLAGAAERIGEGDLESPVPVEGADEVARLAERMEEMRRRLHQTYSQLRELNRLKDEYLFSVAHEVRTPLTSLVASVEVLASDYTDMSSAELEATVRRIERGAIKLQTLVENVLDAGSIRAGRFSIFPSPTSLRQIVEGAVTSLQPVLEEKGQTLQVTVPENLPLVLADERRVAQVFANLLSNASKYGPERDHISVEAHEDEGGALVRVSDHGAGIPLPEQGELFERYFRAPSSSRGSPGTGLGLAISKAIVEAHGGVVGLESEPEHGTTVWFTLPWARQGARVPTPV